MPKYSKIEPYDWLLGQCYDRIVAYLAGTTTNAVQIRRANKGIPPFSDDKAISKPYDPLLGTMSDLALAKIFCVTAYEIGRRRRLLQVDIYEPRQGQKLEDFDHLLPTTSNAEIARRAGCSRQAVAQRRKRLNCAKPVLT
ncbi:MULTISPECIES: AsnC family protein [Pseudomonas]|uniref:AsnC family protein n=1 Tax=Pseudomonas TaxID=286 RepID=UPI0027383883|nr:AsnC family protein [Pseudomonas putida]WLP08730.1 AsnC family protein [Pseudomonas putida]